MAFYLTTDGLIDQVGGDKKRMFGKKRFKSLILENSQSEMQIQGTEIINALNDYQGKEIRRDDVSMIGFTIS